jgi:hypothetical protein
MCSPGSNGWRRRLRPGRRRGIGQALLRSPWSASRASRAPRWPPTARRPLAGPPPRLAGRPRPPRGRRGSASRIGRALRTAPDGPATPGEPPRGNGEASGAAAPEQRCEMCGESFTIARPGGAPKRYCSGRCRTRASKQRQRRHQAEAEAPEAEPDRAPAPAVREPPLEPLPAAIERPFRAPAFGRGAEDPVKAALLASVSRLPWETASP